MRFDLFIAKRIYNNSRFNSFSRPAIIIATAGIAVGIMVMIISVSVVLGFKKEVSNKVVGFNSHIQIFSPTKTENALIQPITFDQKLENVISNAPNISYFQVYSTKAGLLKTDSDFKGIQIKGVGENYDLSFFKEYLVDGEIPVFSSKESSNKILLSRAIASEMTLKVNDKVCMYFFDDNKSNIRARKFIVSGIYDTHLEEFDNQLCLTDLYTINRLNGWHSDEVTGVEIYVEDLDFLPLVMNYLISNINHDYSSENTRCAYSMYELSPNIFSWLDILDMNVVMILILMLVIGGFTVMAGLLIVMLDRIQMIGILNALGCSNIKIRHIFSNFAVMLVGKGIIIGDILGIGICYLQKILSIIALDPNTYYIDSVPISINWFYVLLINVGVLIVSSLVIFGSSFLMGIKEPASNIKWD